MPLNMTLGNRLACDVRPKKAELQMQISKDLPHPWWRCMESIFSIPSKQVCPYAIKTAQNLNDQGRVADL
jgi:hypothetical protein